MKKKILLLNANPLGTDPLNLEKEAREIKEQLQKSERRDQFEFEQYSAVRIEDLRRAMYYGKPFILQFSGHSLKDGLILEDDHGESQLVPTQSLSTFFSLFANQVECVILNSCYSENQAKAINKHIKYVIGMKEEIGDDAAICFSKGFYEAVGAGSSIEDAFTSGQSNLEMNDLANRIKPVLHIKETENNPANKTPVFSLAPNEPIKIFFSSAPEDAKLCEKIDRSLIVLQRQKLIEKWNKKEILSGDNWSKEIDNRLNEAQIILLLVSDNFIASNYCYDLEMERAMERHENGEARVIPIILRQCLWEELPFAKLRSLPSNEVPICSWTKRNEAFYDVASGIQRVIHVMKTF